MLGTTNAKRKQPIFATLTNLLNPDNFSMSGVTVSDGVYTFATGTTAMITQSMITPTVGHLYYGRCYQKCVSGSSYPDGRFEYYVADAGGTGVITFAHASSTTMDNEWHLHSNILSLTGLYAESGWILRSFTVSGTNPFYRKEMLIVDLTEAFGSGKEPTKAWCDSNIPYFVGSKTVIK